MIDIVIVNWNAGSQLLRVIDSIQQHGADLVGKVIIVDNGSSDSSMSAVKAAYQGAQLEMAFVENEENLGFGAACNQGAKLAHSDFLLFLNPDTELFGQSLSIPITFLRAPENQHVAAVGIQLIDEHQQVARSCARFPTLKSFLLHSLGLASIRRFRHLAMHMTDWSHSETREVDHVIGAFLLIKRTTFQALEGFDERFFVYLEDLDLSFRINQSGKRIVYLSTAQAFHAGGGTSRQVKAHRLFYSLRSRLIYGAKHFSKPKALILALSTLIIEPIARIALAIARRSAADCQNTVQAYAFLYKDLRHTIAVCRNI